MNTKKSLTDHTTIDDNISVSQQWGFDMKGICPEGKSINIKRKMDGRGFEPPTSTLRT